MKILKLLLIPLAAIYLVGYDDSISNFDHLPEALRPHRPRWRQWLEFLVLRRVVEPSFDADDLMRNAERMTGLADWDDDVQKSFETALRVLGASLESEAKFTRFGRILAWVQLIQMLGNRLKIVDFMKRNPSVNKTEIVAPVFIFGMPRSGTSFLSKLLSEDEENLRAARLWELQDPVPPCDPDSNSIYKRLRYYLVAMQIEAFRFIAPNLAAVHNVAANNAEECMAIFGMEARSLVFNTMFHVPSYQNWLMDQEQLPALRFHEKFIKTLQFGFKNPKTWLFKAPWYLFLLEELWQVYPNARIVFTHRDPSEMVPSLSSLHARFYGLYSDEVHLKEIGNFQKQQWSKILSKMLQARAAHPEKEDNIIDVPFSRIKAEPMLVIEEIYRKFDLELRKDARKRMENFLQGSGGDGSGKKGSKGKHEYEINWFGLKKRELTGDKGFIQYRERFSNNLV